MTVAKYKNATVRRMKALGLYRAEFVLTINRLAALYVQRDQLEKQFEESGGLAVIEFTNKAGATNLIKSPYLTARSEVYAQLLALERDLGLTPAALKRINESSMKPKRTSSFADALKSLGG